MMIRAVLLVLAVLPAPLLGQVELGVDMNISYQDFGTSPGGTEAGTVTAIALLNPTLRLGVYVTPSVSVEPNLRVVYTNSGGRSARSATLGVSGYWHFRDLAAGSSPFVRAAAAAFIFDATDQDARVQPSLQLGGGVKVDVAPHLLLRLEAFGAYRFETDSRPSSVEAGVAFGFSWISR